MQIDCIVHDSKKKMSFKVLEFYWGFVSSNWKLLGERESQINHWPERRTYTILGINGGTLGGKRSIYLKWSMFTSGLQASQC